LLRSCAVVTATSVDNGWRIAAATQTARLADYGGQGGAAAVRATADLNPDSAAGDLATSPQWAV